MSYRTHSTQLKYQFHEKDYKTLTSLSVYVSGYLSINHLSLSFYLFICLSTHLSIYLHINLSIYISVSIYLTISRSICQSVSQSVYASIYLPVCLRTAILCLSISLSIYLSTSILSIHPFIYIFPQCQRPNFTTV